VILHPADDQTTEASRPPQLPKADRVRVHSGRRWIPLGVLGFIFAATAVGTVSLAIAQGRFIAGREALDRGRQRFLDGDFRGASELFESAASDFASAEDVSSNPVLRAVGWLPIVGRTPDAIIGIAHAGSQSAHAVAGLADSIEGMPGGLAGLAPSGGRVRIDRIERMANSFEAADEQVAQAVNTLNQSPDSLLLPPVARARQSAAEELGGVADRMHSASQILLNLPAFLGERRPARYFFGAQNPAELRGTGGLIGVYSILTIDEGRFSFREFRPTEHLPVLDPEAVRAPNADYAANYDLFRGGHRFWSAINVMPDFPSAAQAILNGYEEATGERLDGVIMTDPFALQALLGIVGPVELPGYGIEIDQDSVVPFTTNEAYALFDDSATRKRILGETAKLVFERFIARPAQSLSDLRVLAQTAAEGHILVHSDHPAVQESLSNVSIGGAFQAGPDDFLAVVVNSAAGSKVDYYQEREISYSVRLGDDQTARTTTTTSLSNDAPTSGQPRIVIGPFIPGTESGRVGPILRHLQPAESVALVNTYCAEDCVPSGIMLNGKSVSASAMSDLGVPYVRTYFSVPAGERAELMVSSLLSKAWEGNDSGGTYRLTFANQVTIRPVRLHIEIQPPEGMHIVEVSDAMSIVDEKAVYNGIPGWRLQLEIAFQPSLPVRLWRDVVRFLSQPVISL
jgi:hypothetical protein